MQMLRHKSKLISTVTISLVVALGLFYWKGPTTQQETISISEIQNSEISTEPIIVEVRKEEVLEQKVIEETLSPQVHLAKEIIESRNDNDPRLDSDLRMISDLEKENFKKFYDSRPMEDRNGRGTVVFLLGRNITSNKDMDFFDSVLAEKSCQSLSDCNLDVTESGQDKHLEGMDDVTLAYPQLVALNALDGLLAEKNKDPDLRESARRALETAKKSENRRISSKAEEISGKWF